MNNFHVTIAIVLLSLLTCWEQGMCSDSKMIIYNTEPEGTIYVTCSGNKAYEVSTSVPNSNKTEISLPPHDSKIWPPVTCIGKRTKFGYKEHILYMSSSNDKSKRCEKTCYVSVASYHRFYRWDGENKKWEIIPTHIWYP